MTVKSSVTVSKNGFKVTTEQLLNLLDAEDLESKGGDKRGDAYSGRPVGELADHCQHVGPSLDDPSFNSPDMISDLDWQD